MTKIQGKRALVAQQPAAAIAAARTRWDQAAKAFNDALAERDRLDDLMEAADRASEVPAPPEMFRMMVCHNGRREMTRFYSVQAIREHYGAIARKLHLETHPKMAAALSAYTAHTIAENAAAERAGYASIKAQQKVAADAFEATRDALIQTPAMDADGLALKIRAAAATLIDDSVDPGDVRWLSVMMASPEDWAGGLAMAGIYMDALRLAGRTDVANALAMAATAEAQASNERLAKFRAETDTHPDPARRDDDGFAVKEWVDAFRTTGGDVSAPEGRFRVSLPDTPGLARREAVRLYEELLADPSKAEAVGFFALRGEV